MNFKIKYLTNKLYDLFSFNYFISIYSIILMIIIFLIPLFFTLWGIGVSLDSVNSTSVSSFNLLMNSFICFLIFFLTSALLILTPIIIFNIITYCLLKLSKSSIRYVQLHNLSILGWLMILLNIIISSYITFPHILSIFLLMIIFYIYGKILSKLSKINIIYNYIII